MPMMMQYTAPRIALWSALQEYLGIETSAMKAWGSGAQPEDWDEQSEFDEDEDGIFFEDYEEF